MNNHIINCVIVGAQKAGTTSLLRYFNEHPNIEGHFSTEFSAFIDDEEFSKGVDKSVQKFYSFDNANPKVVLAKSALLYDNKKGIKRLHSYNPNAKIIFMVREPVKRAISSFFFEKMHGWGPGREFEEIVEIIKDKKYEDGMYRMFIRLGLYSKALTDIYKYFPKENVQIVVFENFKENPQEACNNLFQFLDVEHHLVTTSKIHNKTQGVKYQKLARLYLYFMTTGAFFKNVIRSILPTYHFEILKSKLLDFNKKEIQREAIDSNILDFLHVYFKPYNLELEKMVDLDFSAWKGLH